MHYNLYLYEFQILGITIRADIPLGLDLLKSLWEAIVSNDEDPSTNLQEADPLTYNFMKKIEMVLVLKVFIKCPSEKKMKLNQSLKINLNAHDGH